MSKPSTNIRKHVEDLVSKDLTKIPEDLREWVRAHLIDPRRVMLSVDMDGEQYEEFRLITDHSGHNDSPCRIVYHEEGDVFGLEQTLENGVEWFMGFYGDGSFGHAIVSM